MPRWFWPSFEESSPFFIWGIGSMTIIFSCIKLSRSFSNLTYNFLASFWAKCFLSTQMKWDVAEKGDIIEFYGKSLTLMHFIFFNWKKNQNLDLDLELELERPICRKAKNAKVQRLKRFEKKGEDPLQLNWIENQETHFLLNDFS